MLHILYTCIAAYIIYTCIAAYIIYMHCCIYYIHALLHILYTCIATYILLLYACIAVHVTGIWRGKVDVAVKTLKTGTMSREDFLAEGETMHKLRHRRLVQLMGVCTAEDPIYIITELMVNGSMLDYLRNDEGKCLKFPQMLDMSAQVFNNIRPNDIMLYLYNLYNTAHVTRQCT